MIWLHPASLNNMRPQSFSPSSAHPASLSSLNTIIYIYNSSIITLQLVFFLHTLTHIFTILFICKQHIVLRLELVFISMLNNF